MAITAGQDAVASDFISTSSGASDEGKVPKLDADGVLDPSFLEYGIESRTLGETLSTANTVVALDTSGEVIQASETSLDERLTNIVGILLESGTSGQTKKVQSRGIVAGLTGLTAGADYYLAKDGTTESDHSGGTGSTGNTGLIGIDGSGFDWRVARNVTVSSKGKLRKVTARIYKSGANIESASIICHFRTGNVSGFPNSPGGTGVATKTVAASSFSSGDMVEFDFGEDFVIPAGNYYIYFTYSGISVSSNYFYVQSSSTSSSVYSNYSANSWTSNYADFEYTVDFNEAGVTFSDGDITTWFCDYYKKIGTALSSTTLELDLRKRPSRKFVSKLTHTTYEAECEGMVYAYSPSSSNYTVILEAGATEAELATVVHDIGSGNGNSCAMLVQKGQFWHVDSSQSGTGALTVNFQPII